MRTKREQVQAHRFVIRRIVSGMIQGNPEAMEFPMRRTAGSMIGGLAIALLVFAGFWVVGALFNLGDWQEQDEGTIVVDEETGATYVYLKPALYPVENLTSARLFLEDGGEAPLVHVSTSDLHDVPRGDRFGIPGVPVAPPAADELVTLPWQVCSAPKDGNDKKQESHVTLQAPKAKDRLGDKGQLVVADEEYSLIWNDLRFPVPDPEVLPSVGLQTQDAVTVNNAFLQGIRVGPDLTVPEIPGGDDRHELPGDDDARNGDIFKSGKVTYVLTAEGFAEATEVGVLLLKKGNAPTPTDIDSDVVEDNHSDDPAQPEAWPDDANVLRDSPLTGKGIVCAVYDSADDDDVAVATYPADKAPEAITKAPSTTRDSDEDETSTADHVWTPGGRGALIRAVGTADATDGTVYLIADSKRFAVPEAALEPLGYGGVTPTPVPRSLVTLVPEGPSLDPDKVREGFTELPENK